VAPRTAGAAPQTAGEGPRVEVQMAEDLRIGRTGAGSGGRLAADLDVRTGAGSGGRPGRVVDRRRMTCPAARAGRAGTVRRTAVARRLPIGSAADLGNRRASRRAAYSHRGAARRPDGSHPDAGSATRPVLRVESPLRPPAATASHRGHLVVQNRDAVDRVGSRRADPRTGCRTRGARACLYRPAGVP
jgi:hypothetical protein